MLLISSNRSKSLIFKRAQWNLETQSVVCCTHKSSLLTHTCTRRDTRLCRLKCSGEKLNVWPYAPLQSIISHPGIHPSKRFLSSSTLSLLQHRECDGEVGGWESKPLKEGEMWKIERMDRWWHRERNRRGERWRMEQKREGVRFFSAYLTWDQWGNQFWVQF